MRDRGCKKIAFVTDPLIIKLGRSDAALPGLQKAGVAVWVSSDVVADAPPDIL